MSAIFLAYRRDDSAIGGRIYERLATRFGGAAVLSESDPPPPGAYPPDAIRGAVGRCAAVLVVVSPRWNEPASTAQLANPSDLLRIEVETALQRGIPVFPLLVEGATLPPAQMLPPGMAALASRNGIPLRDGPDFEGDVAQISAIVANLLPASPTPAAGPAYPPYPAYSVYPPYPQMPPQMPAPGYSAAPPANRRSYKGLFWGLGAGLSVLLIVCIVASVLFVNGIRQVGSINIHRNTDGRQPVPANVLSDITHISQQTFAAIGAGELPNPLQQITPAMLVLKDNNGLPIFLYVGAEYCPYCAAERWSIVVALSRFGTFSNLRIISSADAPEVYPDTPSFTFYQSSYTSQYLDFQGVEMQDRHSQPLQQLTPQQNQLFTALDAPPYTQAAQSFPFVDIANQYVGIGAGYQNDVLTSQNWNSIAEALNDPNSPIAQSIIGNANYLDAAICGMTNDQPANVCTAAPIPTLEKTIGKPAGS